MKALRLKKEFRDSADLEEFIYVHDSEVFEHIHSFGSNGELYINQGYYTYTTKSRLKRHLLDQQKAPKKALYKARLELSKTTNVKGFGHPGSKAFKRQVKKNLKASKSVKRLDQLAKEAANKKAKNRTKNSMRKATIKIHRQQKRA